LAPSWRATLQRAQRYELDGRLLEARARLGAWCDVADEVAAGLREIGLAWQRGELTIAEEHVASDGLARALARVGDTLPTRLDGPRFLLACAGSDEHTLGLSLAELCLRELGVSPVWLGRQTPVDELMRELRGPSVRGVVLSASAASGDWAELERTVQLVGAACEEASVSLVLGGAGAWPPNPLYGARASSFGDLRNLLTRPLGNGPS
jgi:methylmalonyl-CoA mutase cobalamin-binding subunit